MYSFLKKTVAIALILVFMSVLMFNFTAAEDIQNTLTKTPPTDLASDNGGGSKTGDAGGGYWRNSSSYAGALWPGMYAGAYPYSSQLGTRWAEGWSEGRLEMENFRCIHSGKYDVTINSYLSGMVGVSVPRDDDFWGNARGRVSVSFEWWVYDDSDGGSQVYHGSNTFFSADKTYCTGACDDAIIYSDEPVIMTCPDIDLAAGHEYSCEVKLRCWGKSEAYGATDHRAYVAAVFTYADFDFGPWDLQVNGSYQLNSITFQDKAPDHTAPTTSINHVGGIYCEPITIELTASDNSGGYGLASTKYRINGGSWLDYSTSIELDYDAAFDFYSTDKAGNNEGIHTVTFIFPPQMAPPTISYEAGCDYIDIAWSSVSGADDYCVYRDGAQMTCLEGTSWRDEDPGTSQRTYTVIAMNACWESGHSAPVVCQIKDVPESPELASPPSGETGLSQPVDLQWNTSEGAESYKVQIANDFEFNSLVLEAEISGTDYEASGLGNVVKYYWRVSAYNECGWGNWSDIWNFTTECPEAGTVVLVGPSDGTKLIPQPVILDWEDADDAVKYEVQVCDNDGFTGINVYSQECLSSAHTCPIMASGVDFYWRVRLYNGCAWSDWSNVWNFSPGEPTDITQLNPDELPQGFRLTQNHPNPFNPMTTFEFSLPVAADASLEILNILGVSVEKVEFGRLTAGNYSYIWDGSGYPSGVYFYRLSAGEYKDTKKMILLK